MSYVKLRTPSGRYAYREMRILEPGKKYVFSAFTAFYVEHLTPLAWAMILKSKGYTGDEVAKIPVIVAELLNENIEKYFRVGIEHAVEEAEGNKYVVQASANNEYAEVVIEERDEFSEDWIASLGLATDRWKRYTENISERDVEAIFRLSKLGYRAFLNPSTPRQITAVLKHSVGLDMVDRSYYLRRLRESVEKYKAGYEEAKEKYAAVTKTMNGVLYAAVDLAYFAAKTF